MMMRQVSAVVAWNLDSPHMHGAQVFQLVDPKELTPLQELIDTIIR
jgi:hypothetical protein